MSENLDGNSIPEGTPASPNAGGSQGSGVSDSSGANPTQAALEKLIKRLDEVDQRTRTLQGDKDRGVNQTRKEIDELKRKFAEVEKLKSKGLSDDDAFEEFELREAIRTLRDQTRNPQAQSQPAGNGEGLVVDKAKTLQEYGLNENDADVAAELAGKNFRSALELENAALKIAFKRSQKPSPDAAASPAVQGTPSRPANVESLTADYQKEMKAVKRGDRASVLSIKEKYKKLGVPVDTVVFT